MWFNMAAIIGWPELFLPLRNSSGQPCADGGPVQGWAYSFLHNPVYRFLAIYVSPIYVFLPISVSRPITPVKSQHQMSNFLMFCTTVYFSVCVTADCRAESGYNDLNSGNRFRVLVYTNVHQNAKPVAGIWCTVENVTDRKF